MPWAPELFSAPVLARLWEDHRRRHLGVVPFFPGLMTGEIDALIESLRALFERFFSNGGGIQLEHCAVTDDGRACALEYNTVAWGRTAVPLGAGVAVGAFGGAHQLLRGAATA